MSRNGSGNYSLPSGNPVVDGTTIEPTWANDTLDDIATEMTASLDRNGKGGMLAALRGIDGTVSAPSSSWTNETISGPYRAGAGDIRWALLGADVLRLNSGALTWWNGSAWRNFAVLQEDQTVTGKWTFEDEITHTKTFDDTAEDYAYKITLSDGGDDNASGNDFNTGLWITGTLSNTDEAGGDTYQRAIWVDLTTTGAADHQSAITGGLTLNHSSTGNVSDTAYGVHGILTRTDGDVDEMYAGFFTAQIDGTDDVDFAAGVYSEMFWNGDADSLSYAGALRPKVETTAAQSEGYLFGISAEIQQDSTDTLLDARVVYANWDGNSAGTVTNGYLFKGDVESTNTTFTNGLYGIHISGEDQNYFSGDLDVGGEFTPVSANETKTAPTSSGGTLTLDCHNGNAFASTLTENTTIAFTNPPASGTAYAMTIDITGASSYTLSWPASAIHPEGITPAAPAAGQTNRYVADTYDGGTTWFVSAAGVNYS